MASRPPCADARGRIASLHMPVIVVSLCFTLLLASCISMYGTEIPRTPKGESFGQAKANRFAYGYAYACLQGEFTGKHVKGYTGGAPLYEQENPGGTGKIYKYYLLSTPDTPSAAPTFRFTPRMFTFTVHTTDKDIVTRCAATMR